VTVSAGAKPTGAVFWPDKLEQRVKEGTTAPERRLQAGERLMPPAPDGGHAARDAAFGSVPSLR
jgi:hypothetical protein